MNQRVSLGSLPLRLLPSLQPTIGERHRPGRDARLHRLHRLHRLRLRSEGRLHGGRRRENGSRRDSGERGGFFHDVDRSGLRARRVGSGQLLGATGRRIRLFGVRSAQRDRELGLGSQRGIFGLAIAGPERAELHRHAERGQLGQRAQQRGRAIGPATIERDRDMRTIREDLPDQVAEHGARADLDEGVDAGGGHGLDHLREADRLGDLPTQARALGRRVALVRRRGLARVDRHARGREAQLGQERGEGLRARGHDRRVEGRRDREPPDLHAGLLEHLLGLGDRLGRPADDALIGRVEVGQHDLVEASEQLADARLRGHDGAHRAGLRERASLGHQLAATPRDAEHVLLAEHARGVQGRDLAEAVPRDRAGLDAELAEHRQQRRARAADRRLSPLRGPQRQLVGLAGRVVEARDREHDPLEPEPEVRRAIPSSARGREVHGQVGAHLHVLAALAGEEQADRSLPGTDAVAGPVGRLELGLGLGLDLPGRALEPSSQVARVSQQRQSSRGVGVELLLRLPSRPTKDPRLVGSGRPRTSTLGNRSTIGAADRDQLGRHRAQQLGVLARTRVLLEQQVEVRTTEAERAHARATQVIGAADPRSRLGVEVEGRVLDVELGVGPLDLDRRRQHLVVQRHHGLEEPGRAGGRLGVADLRLDRSERAPLRLALADREGQLQPAELGRVAGLGPGPVGLDQLDRVRLEAGVGLGAAQGLGLALGHRRIDALRLAVRRRADPTQHRVDVIAVALGVGEALERDHAQTLAEHRAVGRVREGPAITRGRERRGLAEAHEHEDVVERVDAARDDQIRVAQVELLRGHVDRREGRGARGIGHAVGPAEVEAVGDPTGDDVAEQAREAALFPGCVVVGDPLGDRLDLVLGHAVVAHRLDPNRLLQPADHGREQLLGRGHAEDHRDPRAIHALELPAGGVTQDLLGNDQAEQLRGVGRLDDLRRHAPGRRVEVDVRDEPAALGVGLVGRAGVRVVVVLGQPVGRRDVGQQIGAGPNVGPKAGRVLRAGEQGGDADDGDGRTLQVGHGTQSSGRGRKSNAAAGTGTP